MSVGLTTMTWQFTHSCLNGENIQVRYFDETNLGFWPADPTQVFIYQPGQTATSTLSCTIGAKVCFGANQPAHGLFWGVDIDNSRSCTACCATCNGTDPQPQNFTCN